MKWAVFIFLLNSFHVFGETVNLKISETKNKSGRIFIAVFNDPGEFPDKKAILNKIVPITSYESTYEVKIDLPPGDYALSIFLDENGNNILDKNFLGIPKERFGFSNNPRIGTGAPSFQECEVRIEKENHEFEIKLLKLI